MKHLAYSVLGTALLISSPEIAKAQCGPFEGACIWALQHPQAVVSGGTALGNAAISGYQYLQNRPPVQYYSYPPAYAFPQSTPYAAMPRYAAPPPPPRYVMPPQFRRR